MLDSESKSPIAITDSNVVAMRFIKPDKNLAETKNKELEDSKNEGKGVVGMSEKFGFMPLCACWHNSSRTGYPFFELSLFK